MIDGSKNLRANTYKSECRYLSPKLRSGTAASLDIGERYMQI